ncbi:E3 ubiquitin-protein ligase RHA2A-like [Diospyros lotus]|uniref:E3 ubiquitin-protein ligase RHA2A-like n=1 Tax=Diospyros lotus TaxID=55363 RepID=UPI00224CE150|nr:E3 ubiquitin-protein ligase RHA2A-like [Diospyros lotus]
MGLQGHVSDCSSESIFILFIAIIASCLSYLRSAAFLILRSLGLSRFDPDHVDDGFLLDAVGSGLARLIVLTEQLDLNRVFSHRYAGDAGGEVPPACVVCLSALGEGEQVRRLPCRHVFHKGCLDGWLDHLNFSCPLCRSPLVSERRVALAEKRVSRDILGFFTLR